MISMGLAMAERFDALARQMRLQAEGLFANAPISSTEFQADLIAHIEAMRELELHISRWPEKWKEFRQPTSERHASSPNAKTDLH